MSSILQPAFYHAYKEIQIQEGKTYYFYHGAINASQEAIKQLGNVYRNQKFEVFDINERLRNSLSLPTNFQGIAIRYEGSDTIIKIDQALQYLDTLIKKQDELKENPSESQQDPVPEGKKLIFYR